MYFKNREEAGSRLADALQRYRKAPHTLVLGLVRGGVAVAAEVARLLQLPLDVLVVRKVGAPGNPELALGAIAEAGEGVFNTPLIAYLGVTPQALQQLVDEQRQEVHSRLALYRTQPLDLTGKTAILIDDGIATGASMQAAIHSVRAQGASHTVLAVPVAAPEAVRTLTPLVDEAVVLHTPTSFEAVGEYYTEFGQLTDREVSAYLTLAKRNCSS